MDFYRLLPKYWFQNYETSLSWDKRLNELMDNGAKVVTSGPYSIKLDGIRVWAGNWPYAYGAPYLDGPEVLPKVKTRKRLREYIAGNF